VKDFDAALRLLRGPESAWALIRRADALRMLGDFKVRVVCACVEHEQSLECQTMTVPDLRS